MRIIVVGATGYIGRIILAKARLLVPAIGTSSCESGMLHLNLLHPGNFDYSEIKTGDVVILTAAISAPDICARNHAGAWALNVEGTTEFIRRSIIHGARVIFFSSDTVYGECDTDCDESMPCNPAGDYAIMKHEVESRFFDNPLFKTIRLSYVFSRDDKFTKYLRGCAEHGEEAEIFHPFYRAVVHRDDVVQGAIALARRWDEFPQSVINFGGPDVISRIDFAQILKNIALSTLRFRKINPGADFFVNRPRVIRMKSPLLPLLLERPARSLMEAAYFEFLSEGEKEND